MDLVRFNPGKGLREIRETRRSGVYQGVCAPLPPEQKVGGSNPLGRTKSIYNQRFAGLYANNGGQTPNPKPQLADVLREMAMLPGAGKCCARQDLVERFLFFGRRAGS